MLFASCGEELVQRTEPAQESSHEPRGPLSLNGDIEAKQGLEFSYNGQNLFDEDVSSGFTFVLQDEPGWLSINPSTGELTGEPTVNKLESDIRIIATNGGNIINSDPFSIAVNGDPLRKYAWHITNTGQTTFANSGGTVGVDLNAYDAFKKGYTGEGVKIVVSDSGVELNHDELFLQTIEGEHKNYTLEAPYFGTPTPTSSHGTAVTGIINAMGWNNRGSIGVAPGAKFVGYQFLSSPQTIEILIDQASGNYDVYNYSYGETVYHDVPSDQDYLDHLKFEFLNSNKLFVKSSGNEFIQIQDNLCVSHNAIMPFEHDSPFMLVVGAIDAEGNKAFYSNAGANLWVVGTGGHTGVSAPAIMTTDLPTCFKGYSKATSSPDNDFEYGHPDNTECDYTSVMNGTSAAAPSVTGVIALIKEANPSLSSRDIKHILASTSAQVDASFSNPWGNDHPSQAIGGCTDLSLSGHIYEQGWVTNAAGYKFSNFYGFGLVDADAAVTMAEGYASTLGSLVETNSNFDDADYFSGNVNLSIPDQDKDGVENTMNITDNLTIEAVQILVDIDHTASGELGVEITSPAGTKSILLNINNSLLIEGDENLSDMVLLSNAFYGESSQGTWTLKVIDGKLNNTGKLNYWKMNILGH